MFKGCRVERLGFRVRGFLGVARLRVLGFSALLCRALGLRFRLGSIQDSGFAACVSGFRAQCCGRRLSGKILPDT